MSQFHPSIGFDAIEKIQLNDATILMIPAIKIKKCNFVSKLFDLLFVPAKIRIEFFVHSLLLKHHHLEICVIQGTIRYSWPLPLRCLGNSESYKKRDF